MHGWAWFKEPVCVWEREQRCTCVLYEQLFYWDQWRTCSLSNFNVYDEYWIKLVQHVVASESWGLWETPGAANLMLTLTWHQITVSLRLKPFGRSARLRHALQIVDIYSELLDDSLRWTQSSFAAPLCLCSLSLLTSGCWKLQSQNSVLKMLQNEPLDVHSACNPIHVMNDVCPCYKYRHYSE